MPHKIYRGKQIAQTWRRASVRLQATVFAGDYWRKDLRKYLCFYSTSEYFWIPLGSITSGLISPKLLILVWNTTKKEGSVLWARCNYRNRLYSETEIPGSDCIQVCLVWVLLWKTQQSPGLPSTDEWTICPRTKAAITNPTKRNSKAPWVGELSQNNTVASQREQMPSSSSESCSW